MIVRLAGVLAVVGVATAAAQARAGVEIGTLSPRAIGHAGASIVSDDGAAAAFQCPAAIARRDERRAQAAGLAIDDDAALVAEPLPPRIEGHPRVRDGGGATLAPLVGVQGHAGAFVIAASVAVTERLERTLPSPLPGAEDEELEDDFPHRYAGLSAGWSRRAIAIAAAYRPTEWLAIGASATVAQVDVSERRRLWAGFRGRDPLAHPARDVDVAIAAGDAFVPGGALGVLIAPLDTQLELAAGVSWADDVHADGELGATAVGRDAPELRLTGPHAAARFASPLVASVGVRWLGERWAIEGAATWTGYPTGDEPWRIAGVEVVDQSGARAVLATLPSRLPRRDHGSLAIAIDVEALPGFVWLTGAYRWAGGSAPGPQVATVGADLGGHTIAAGAELAAGGATITIGVARQLERTTHATAPGLPLDNPFPGGTAPANLGAHAASLDLVGVGLEIAMP